MHGRVDLLLQRVLQKEFRFHAAHAAEQRSQRSVALFDHCEKQKAEQPTERTRVRRNGC